MYVTPLKRQQFRPRSHSSPKRLSIFILTPKKSNIVLCDPSCADEATLLQSIPLNIRRILAKCPLRYVRMKLVKLSLLSNFRILTASAVRRILSFLKALPLNTPGKPRVQGRTRPAEDTNNLIATKKTSPGTRTTSISGRSIRSSPTTMLVASLPRRARLRPCSPSTEKST